MKSTPTFSLRIPCFAFCIFSCRVERPYPPPTAEELHRYIATLGHPTLRAEARVDYTTSSGHVRATVLMLAAKDRLRLDILSPVHSTLQTLVVRGPRYQLWDAKENRFEQGDAASCGIRVLPIPMQPGDASLLLRGGIPLLAGRVEAGWDSSDGAELLRVYSSESRRQEIRLIGPRNRWKLLREEIFSAHGESELRIDVGEGSLRLRSSTRHQDIKLLFRKSEHPAGLPDQHFQLEAPPGATIEERPVCQ